MPGRIAVHAAAKILVAAAMIPVVVAAAPGKAEATVDPAALVSHPAAESAVPALAEAAAMGETSRAELVVATHVAAQVDPLAMSAVALFAPLEV
jgi:hypothetical protein